MKTLAEHFAHFCGLKGFTDSAGFAQHHWHEPFYAGAAAMAELFARGKQPLKDTLPVDRYDKGHDFRRDVATVINRLSLENDSDTPDYVLSAYLWDCLQSFNDAMVRREAYRDTQFKK